MDQDHLETLLLFLSVSSLDHEDAMNAILPVFAFEIEGGEEDEFGLELEDMLYASQFAGVYHIPTSFEQDAIDEIKEILNGEEKSLD